MKITRILVIDDDPTVTRGVKSALGQRSPFHVREESDFSRAHITARNYRPDLIILSMDPPTPDRYILAKELEFDPALHAVPVVRVSGPWNGDRATAPSGLSLAKPLDSQRLAETIYSALADRKEPAAAGSESTPMRFQATA